MGAVAFKSRRPDSAPAQSGGLVMTAELGLGCGGLVEAKAVAKWVRHFNAQRAVCITLDTGSQVRVILGEQLRVISHETLDAYKNGRSGAGVAVMLRQMQNEGPERDLHVEGQPGFETVL